MSKHTVDITITGGFYTNWDFGFFFRLRVAKLKKAPANGLQSLMFPDMTSLILNNTVYSISCPLPVSVKEAKDEKEM